MTSYFLHSSILHVQSFTFSTRNDWSSFHIVQFACFTDVIQGVLNPPKTLDQTQTSTCLPPRRSPKKSSPIFCLQTTALYLPWKDPPTKRHHQLCLQTYHLLVVVVPNLLLLILHRLTTSFSVRGARVHQSVILLRSLRTVLLWEKNHACSLHFGQGDLKFPMPMQP